MIDSAVVAQLFPVVRQISAKRGPVRSLCCMAMEHFPMHFASTVNGSPIDLVCKIKLFDETHAAHILVSRDGQDFLFAGCLNAPKTKVLEHHVPSCDSLKSVVDLCAGVRGGWPRVQLQLVSMSEWQWTTTRKCLTCTPKQGKPTQSMVT